MMRMLETTNLHNDMILYKLSISSHGFTFGFPEKPRTNGDVFLTYKPMINPLISQCGTPLLTILPSNKLHHKASPKAYGALEQSPLNRGSTPSLEFKNKVHLLFDTCVTFDYTFEAHNFFVRH